MKKPAFVLGLIVLVTASSGCAQLLSPYGYGPGYRPYPVGRPAVLPVDQSEAARGRWDQVMRLPNAATIDVLTVDGAAYVGRLTAADGHAVRLMVNGVEEQVSRADVLRIDLVDLPGSEVGAVAKRAAAGAVLGVGAAALVAGVIGGPAWPPPGAMLRGGAALGGVAGGEAALAGRQGRVVYLAENQQPLRRSNGGPGDNVSEAAIIQSITVDAWSAIESLPIGETVQVVRTNSWRHIGRVIAVDGNSLRLDIDGAELRLTRASIVRVEVLRIREGVSGRRSQTHLVPRPGLNIVGVSVDRFSPQASGAATAVAPLIRIGLPMLPFGGAQPQILQFQIASNHLVPMANGALPPGVGGTGISPGPMRAVVCHGHATRLR